MWKLLATQNGASRSESAQGRNLMARFERQLVRMLILPLLKLFAPLVFPLPFRNPIRAVVRAKPIEYGVIGKSRFVR